MQRRTFLNQVAFTILATQTKSLKSLVNDKGLTQHSLLSLKPVEPPKELKKEFEILQRWLHQNNWTKYLEFVTGIPLAANILQPDDVWSRTFPDVLNHPGFEDFAGIRLIEPGYPSMSLLYHALASPRVLPSLQGVNFEKNQYPTLEQLDQLENYIYSLTTVTIPENELKENYVVSVFAYEYRPAYKTPDKFPWADFVYSRTGIARVGEFPLNYDRKSRSFSNEPQESKHTKSIAVTPSRYALFLAKKVPGDEATLFTYEHHDIKGAGRFFLQPVRKIFDYDPMVGGGQIRFLESHRNEKLARILEFSGIKAAGGYDKDKPPFVKESASDTLKGTYPRHSYKLVEVAKVGASMLVSSVPKPLISFAQQGGDKVGFEVEAEKGKGLHTDRRYTSLRLQANVTKNAIDYIETEALYKKYRATRFSAPRNAPMFANIRYILEPSTGKISYIEAGTKDFDKKMVDGGYATTFFEDNICDGCVVAEVYQTKDAIGPIVQSKLEACFPAFSLVAAPDFFPYSDSYDFEQFDEAHDTSFMEGGIENLSYCRLPANPNINHPRKISRAFVQHPKWSPDAQYQEETVVKNTFEDQIAFDVSDSVIAMICGATVPTNSKYNQGRTDYRDQSKRDYQAASYLPDTAAFVFAPGWDITYSSNEPKGFRYLATFGLGSPFPEDMKLCAAANGMWPVASPDAARTFLGSLEPLKTGLFSSQRTPTAIPLMDDEIGISSRHPSVIDSRTTPKGSSGWDGEQGPCIEWFENKFWINFTDIRRADYVHNLLDPSLGFDASRLRDLSCHELINRMEALRRCKMAIEGSHPKFSKLWLVSAEKVSAWPTANAYGIPANLIGNDKEWAKNGQGGVLGPGYLYLFADPVYGDDQLNIVWDQENPKRRRMAFKSLYLCQLAAGKIAWCKIPAGGLSNSQKIDWMHG